MGRLYNISLQVIIVEFKQNPIVIAKTTNPLVSVQPFNI